MPEYTKCPKCEAQYCYSDLKPENIAGTGFWSDGFYMAPMRNDIINFAKCPACNTYFWLEENSIPKPQDSSQINNIENSWLLDQIGSKEINFIKDAFRAGLAINPEKEIVLRIKLWQVINHIIRKYDSQGLFKKIRLKIFESNEYKDSHKQYNSLSSIKINNLIRLANLLKLDLSENPDNLLFAEIYRELGDFSKAMIFCHRAETTLQVDSNRILLLKEQIKIKSKTAYKI